MNRLLLIAGLSLGVSLIAFAFTYRPEPNWAVIMYAGVVIVGQTLISTYLESLKETTDRIVSSIKSIGEAL